MSTTSQRVSRLRDSIQSKGLDAVIVPSADPHQGEYTPPRYQSRAYLSGFTGSAGTVVVTADRAGLWTDSRYFIAGERALQGTEFVLHRSGVAGATEYPDWLAHNLPRGARVGVDSRLITVTDMRLLAGRLQRAGIELVPAGDPMESVWLDRPDLPSEPVWPLDEEYTGEPVSERLRRVRIEMQNTGTTAHVITTLDDIAWLFNLRGSDVAFNPLFLAYAIVTATDATLFTDASRLRDDAVRQLRSAHVTVDAYDAFEQALKTLTGTVLVDPDRVSWYVRDALSGADVLEHSQPTTLMKARKNAVELGHIRNAMVRDGVAMVRFLAWLDRHAAAGDPLDEGRAARKLGALRAEDSRYISDSFNYISGWAENGAIVHYSYDPASPATFGSRGVYLIDSGAHYLDGTTDITRTVAVGSPTEEEREDFTLVLKGHIALARLHMPQGTSGQDVDAVARSPLWMHHRTFGHGTGHGVGFVLNVHEGPQRIAPGKGSVALEPGMVVSNEPGLYREGHYGIRVENLMAVRAAGGGEFGEFLSFETLTLCPIDLRLVDVELLDAGEREWLNEYHRVVREHLESALDEQDRAWLENATRRL